MQTVLEKEKVSLFQCLSDGLMSNPHYEQTLQKALAMPDCPVVPFFGFFMREIRQIMKETPSAVVLIDQDRNDLTEVTIKLFLIARTCNIRLNTRHYYH